MIGKLHVRHAETHRADGFGTQDEIQTQLRIPRGIRRQPLRVRIVKVERAHELFDLLRAVERVEISGDDDRFRVDGGDFHQIIELSRARFVTEREMHEEEPDPADVQFQNQFFESDGEIIDLFFGGVETGEECVSLFAENGDPASDGAEPVLHAAERIMFEPFRHERGLIDESGPERPGVDLDESDDVRIAPVDEIDDPVEIFHSRMQIAVSGEDGSDSAGGSGSVCDIVNKQSHSVSPWE